MGADYSINLWKADGGAIKFFVFMLFNKRIFVSFSEGGKKAETANFLCKSQLIQENK
jgi:hypothetical protein